MNKLIFILFLSLLLPISSAICSENQININTASLTELDELKGVGETIAQYIIDARPYSSVDDLINAKRIKNITLGKIKAQGLACVEEETINSNESISSNVSLPPKEEIPEQTKEIIQIEFQESIENKITSFAVVEESIPEEPLKLNPKTIKTENSNFNDKAYLKYTLIGLGFIFCALLLLKKRKRKNEFTT
ncbi:MAG: helix-hairpin-helix domain-containing protein [Nanoarchaeota archaeon]|nr:helix-hairpin-helix domain-containing protein [Nanoarchaeota archaeon]